MLGRDLIIHNIFHEKQHPGQIWSIRDQLQILQGWGNQDLPMLLADYYTAQAQLNVGVAWVASGVVLWLPEWWQTPQPVPSPAA